MQTFILDTDLAQSAAFLDTRRCFCQAKECKQIYLAINNESKGWRKHPAVLQWYGWADHLLSYGIECLLDSFYDAPKLEAWYTQQKFIRYPDFPPRFHKLIPFHQGLLVRKDYHYYHDIFPSAISTSWARYLDTEGKVFHIKFGEKIYDPPT